MHQEFHKKEDSNNYHSILDINQQISSQQKNQQLQQSSQIYEQIRNKLKGSSILVNTSIFKSHPQVKIINYNRDYHLLNVNIEYGYYSMGITMAVFDKINPITSIGSINHGSFGSIFQIQYNQRKVAVKSLHIEGKGYENVLKQSLIQYLLLNIAAAVKAGPQIIKIFGFDLLVFKDSIAFSMQFCDNQPLKTNLPQTIQKSLKKKLKLLHELKMIHLDIKPQNISFSNQLKQFIFIDFGISKIIKQSPGEKSKTVFVGSIDYCSREMYELFISGNSGMVDLYANDEASLEKTLKTGEIGEEVDIMENDDQMKEQGNHLSNRPSNLILDRQTLLRFLKINKFLSFTNLKFYLFQLSNNIQVIKNESFELYQQTTLNFLLQSYQFCKTLSKTSLLLQYQKNYFSQIQANNQYSNLAELSFPIYLLSQQLSKNQFIQSTFKILANLQISLSIDQNLFTNEIAILQDATIISKMRLGLYLLILAKFIKINSYNKDFQSKIQVCKICETVFFEERNQEQGEGLYKKVLLFILDNLEKIQINQRIQILKSIIETLIILQIIPQQRIIDLFHQCYHYKIQFITKIRILFEFIFAVDLVNQKYKSNYDSEQLLSNFMHKINLLVKQFLSNSEGDKEEISIIKSIQLIIAFTIPIEPLPTLNFQQFLTKYATLTLQSDAFEIDRNIHAYLFSKILIHSIDKYQSCHRFHLNYLALHINRGHQHHRYLSIFHLIYYQINIKVNSSFYNQTLYGFFYQEIKYFTECRYFHLYLLHFIRKLTDQKDSSLEITQEINHILENLMNSKKIMFHAPLKLIMNSIFLFKSSNDLLNFTTFIQNNRLKLLSIPHIFHPNSPYLHNSNIQTQIDLARKMLEFISLFQQYFIVLDRPQLNINKPLDSRNRTYQSISMNKQLWIQQYSEYIKQYENILKDMQCFYCKFYGLLQLKQVEIIYLLLHGKIQQCFHLSYEVFLVYYKNNLYNYFKVCILMIKIWVKHDFLQKKYDIKPFLYSIISTEENCIHALSNIQEYQILYNLYLYAAGTIFYRQLIDFVKGLIRALTFTKCKYSTNNFYFTILKICHQQSKLRPNLLIFKQYHDRVVKYLSVQIDYKRYPYLALYYAALLDIKIKSEISFKMVKWIAFCLPILDKYCRDIILNRYFIYFQYFVPNKEKKLRFLYSQQLRFGTAENTLKYICQRRIKKTSSIPHSKNLKLLTRFIYKYYCNIEVVKQVKKDKEISEKYI